MNRILLFWAALLALMPCYGFGLETASSNPKFTLPLGETKSEIFQSLERGNSNLNIVNTKFSCLNAMDLTVAALTSPTVDLRVLPNIKLGFHGKSLTNVYLEKLFQSRIDHFVFLNYHIFF